MLRISFFWAHRPNSSNEYPHMHIYIWIYAGVSVSLCLSVSLYLCLSVALTRSRLRHYKKPVSLLLFLSLTRSSLRRKRKKKLIIRVALVKEPNTSTVSFRKMCVSLSLPLSHSLSPQTRAQRNTIQSQVGFCKRAQHIDRSILGRYVCVCISLSLSRLPETHHSRRRSDLRHLDLQIYTVFLCDLMGFLVQMYLIPYNIHPKKSS